MKVAVFIPHSYDLNTTPPLGPLYLLSMLEKNNFDVWLFDSRIDSNALNNLISFSPQIVGISSVTSNFNSGLLASKHIKNHLPDATIVFGGPHPTVLPDTIIKENSIDYVLTNEAEYTFLDLCTAIRNNDISTQSLSKISNLYYKIENEHYHTGNSEFLSENEINNLPYPAFHKMEISKYFCKSQTHGLFRKGKRILPIITSRGCPNTCTFCCRILGSKIRYRDIDSVIFEINHLSKTYNIDEIYIEDDNFTLKKDRALYFLDKFASLKPNLYLKFANGLRTDTVNKEILLAMKKANVYSISFGIESGNESTLKKMKKNLNLELSRENILLAKSMGFLVGSNCIIGYPGENIADIRKSMNYFFSLPLDSMAIVNLVPFPGTEIRDICLKHKYLTKEASIWDNYYFSINQPIPLIETPQLSTNQLVKIIKHAYFKMYLNPRWLFNNLKHLPLKHILKGIKLFMPDIFSKK